MEFYVNEIRQKFPPFMYDDAPCLYEDASMMPPAGEVAVTLFRETWYSQNSSWEKQKTFFVLLFQF